MHTKKVEPNKYTTIKQKEQKMKLALELYKSHKISISQGAKFLDMDIYSFMKLLNENQIPAIDDYDIEAELNALKGIYLWGIKR